MKRMILTAIFSLVLTLSITSCDRNKPEVQDPPLKQDMSFTYEETIIYQGRTLSKTITLEFEKAENNMFTSYRTVTDKNGTMEGDPLLVDKFFRYNEVMDFNVSGYAIWMNPKDLATGQIVRLEVIEDTFNGKDVYAALLSNKDTAYYDMDTGFLEGAYIDLGDKSQTVVRID